MKPTLTDLLWKQNYNLAVESLLVSYDEFVFTLPYFFCLFQVTRACATCLKGMGCVRSLKEVPASRTAAFLLPRGSTISGRPPPQARIRTRDALPLGWPGSLCSLRYTSTALPAKPTVYISFPIMNDLFVDPHLKLSTQMNKNKPLWLLKSHIFTFIFSDVQVAVFWHKWSSGSWCMEPVYCPSEQLLYSGSVYLAKGTHTCSVNECRG